MDRLVVRFFTSAAPPALDRLTESPPVPRGPGPTRPSFAPRLPLSRAGTPSSGVDGHKALHLWSPEQSDSRCRKTIMGDPDEGRHRRDPLRHQLSASRRKARAVGPHAGGPAWVADHPEADLLDTAFASRLAAALAADDWGEIMRVFLTQVSAGETGTRKLIEGGVAAWTELPLLSLRNFFSLDDPGCDVRALLPTIRVPTLVLHGEMDRLNPVEMARRTSAQIPGAQFHALAGRSHMMMATATSEFAELVRRFILTGAV